MSAASIAATSTASPSTATTSMVAVAVTVTIAVVRRRVTSILDDGVEFTLRNAFALLDRVQYKSSWALYVLIEIVTHRRNTLAVFLVKEPAKWEILAWLRVLRIVTCARNAVFAIWVEVLHKLVLLDADAVARERVVARLQAYWGQV